MQQKPNKPILKTVVAFTLLVSMDFFFRSYNNQILLSQRTNRPVKGYWFVLGGLICKDETFDQASVA